MAVTIEPTKPEEVKTEKKKRSRSKKPLYVLAEGASKLEATPEDFDPEKQRLTSAMFKDKPCWFEHQAAMAERHAVELREKAAEWRINPPARRSGAKKAKLLSRLEKLSAKLKELGVDVEALLAEDEGDAAPATE
jgi:hypothetical protein